MSLVYMVILTTEATDFEDLYTVDTIATDECPGNGNGKANNGQLLLPTNDWAGLTLVIKVVF